MKHKTFIHSLLLSAFLCLAFCVSAQTVYDVKPVFENYSFSYNQTPENLISSFTVPGNGNRARPQLQGLRLYPGQLMKLLVLQYHLHRQLITGAWLTL